MRFEAGSHPGSEPPGRGPEPDAAPTRGLHGARLSGGAGSEGGQPRRYVLPVGAVH